MENAIKIPNAATATAIDIYNFREDLKKPNFTLKQVGVSNKTFHDWRSVDVVPISLLKKEGEGYKDIKFNFYEWLWLQIVKDLRLLGISYKNIQLVRNNIWQAIEVESQVKQNINKSVVKAIKKSKSKLKNLTQELEDVLEQIPEGESLQNTPHEIIYWIEVLIMSCLLTKEEIKFLLRYDGEFLVFRSDDSYQGLEVKPSHIEYNEKFALFTHFSVSLLQYVNRFFTEEQFLPFLPKVGFITTDEFEVLEMIRKGGMKELTVKIDAKSGNMKGYEFTSANDISQEEMYALVRTFFLKQYESVSFKWKDNRTVYFEKTSKKQF